MLHVNYLLEIKIKTKNSYAPVGFLPKTLVTCLSVPANYGHDPYTHAKQVKGQFV